MVVAGDTSSQSAGSMMWTSKPRFSSASPRYHNGTGWDAAAELPLAIVRERAKPSVSVPAQDRPEPGSHERARLQESPDMDGPEAMTSDMGAV